MFRRRRIDRFRLFEELLKVAGAGFLAIVTDRLGAVTRTQALSLGRAFVPVLGRVNRIVRQIWIVICCHPVLTLRARW